MQTEPGNTRTGARQLPYPGLAHDPWGDPARPQAVATSASYPAPSTPAAPGPPPGQPFVRYRPAQAGSNGLAIASLVLGIVWVYGITSILALIFGHIALSQIKRNGQQGRGMAIAGVVFGWIGVGLLVLMIIVRST